MPKPSNMWESSGYLWDNNGAREHCYKVIPKELANDARAMTLNCFDIIYAVLTKLNYKFRDAGNCAEYAIISLNKKISKKHLKNLEATLSIEPSNGDLLSGC
ncbi:MAG: hypothetical protein Q7K43_06710 [Candidatus Woesearchaeota archaeon]|nr:hypothetical protein [Candidatus Woesearchaeota archaeon]